MADARAWAWVSSWDHLEAARELQQKCSGSKGYSFAEVEPYVAWLQRAAEIYGELACAAEAVGAEAALILQQRKERDEQHRRMFKDGVL